MTDTCQWLGLVLVVMVTGTHPYRYDNSQVTSPDWTDFSEILGRVSDLNERCCPSLSLCLSCSLSCSRWTSVFQRTGCGSTGTGGTYLCSTWMDSLWWNIEWTWPCWTNFCRMPRQTTDDSLYLIWSIINKQKWLMNLSSLCLLKRFRLTNQFLINEWPHLVTSPREKGKIRSLKLSPDTPESPDAASSSIFNLLKVQSLWLLANHSRLPPVGPGSAVSWCRVCWLS